MIKNDKLFLAKSAEVLDEIVASLKSAPVLKLEELNPQETALIMVDMLKGFTFVGKLASPGIAEIIPVIKDILERCQAAGMQVAALADEHTEQSVELATHLEHCLKGSVECEMVDELAAIGGYTLIKKNSTNSFHVAEFTSWLKQNSHLRNFIVVGCCTNICIDQAALTLKTYFNQQNKQARVIVPINAVETYDVGLHYGDLMNVMALYNMSVNGGIEVVSALA